MNRADRESMERLQEGVRERRNPGWREKREGHLMWLTGRGEAKQLELEAKKKEKAKGTG